LHCTTAAVVLFICFIYLLLCHKLFYTFGLWMTLGRDSGSAEKLGSKTAQPQSLFRYDGKRSDCTSVVPWKQCRCLVWDETCPDTLAQSYLNLAVTGAGVAANDAESHKQHFWNVLLQ